MQPSPSESSATSCSFEPRRLPGGIRSPPVVTCRWRRTSTSRRSGSQLPTPARHHTSVASTTEPDLMPGRRCSRRGAAKGREHAAHAAGVGRQWTRTLASMRDGLGDVAVSPTAGGGVISRAARTMTPGAPGDELAGATQDRALLHHAQRRRLGVRPTITRTSSLPTGRARRNLTPGEFQHSGISLPGCRTSHRHDTSRGTFCADLYLVALTARSPPSPAPLVTTCIGRSDRRDRHGFSRRHITTEPPHGLVPHRRRASLDQPWDGPHVETTLARPPQ